MQKVQSSVNIPVIQETFYTLNNERFNPSNIQSILAKCSKWKRTSMPVLCVEVDSRKQLDLRNFSLYQGGQVQVLSH